MLDEANTLLASGNGSMDATADIMYGGDVSKWQKFANSLKFRMLMRISGKQDVSGDLTALMSRPMFTSNDDEAKLVYLSASPSNNPVHNTVVAGSRNEWKVSDKIVDALVDRNDARLPFYAQTKY